MDSMVFHQEFVEATEICDLIKSKRIFFRIYKIAHFLGLKNSAYNILNFIF